MARPKPFIWVLAGVWVLWMAFLLYAVVSDRSLRETGTHTTGVILAVDDADLDADVRFVTKDGDTVVTNVEITDGSKMPSTHDELEVIYDPSDPSRAVFPYTGGVDEWIMKWVALPMAGLAPGAVLFLWWRRDGRRGRHRQRDIRN